MTAQLLHFGPDSFLKIALAFSGFHFFGLSYARIQGLTVSWMIICNMWSSKAKQVEEDYASYPF